MYIDNYVIVNNSDTCFINIYGVLACTPTLFTVYSAYVSGANANLAAQPLAWLFSGEAIAAEPTDTA